ncbi:MAG: S24 family peptidase [Thermoanaerobaculia bacterium]|nr:S24 family peptidase [Thermoanaerobaculia bacterium]
MRFVETNTAGRYVTSVPFVPLKVAAGAFGDPQTANEDDFEWVEIETNRRLRPGMFVAQVAGRSMEPAIPDGSFCLFQAPVSGSRQGRTVLVQLRDATDPETGHRYTVKRYESEKVPAAGSWRHSLIKLMPNNPEFAPIIVENPGEDSVQVIAELVEVVGSTPPARSQ